MDIPYHVETAFSDRTITAADTDKFLLRIPQTIVVHPRYYSSEAVAPYDFALIKVYGNVSLSHQPDVYEDIDDETTTTTFSSNGNVVPWIRINRNPSIPMAGEELAVMGWGRTEPGDNDDGPSSPVLLESRLEAVALEQCGLDLTQNVSVCGEFRKIGFDSCFLPFSDALICAGDRDGDNVRTDVCQGDSGGPLVQLGESATSSADDLHIGLVSFTTFGCAVGGDSGFARTSRVAHWIDEQVCALSENPPKDFGCNASVSRQPDDSSSSSSGMVSVTLSITVNGPAATLYRQGWLVQGYNRDGIYVTYAGDVGGYQESSEPPFVITNTFELPNNKAYQLSILSYEGREATRLLEYEVELNANGQNIGYWPFNGDLAVYAFLVEFELGNAASDTYSTQVDLGPPSPKPEEDSPFLSVGILMDDWPGEVGYFVEAIYPDKPAITLKEVHVGTLNDTEVVSDRIPLLSTTEDQDYRFTMMDSGIDGLSPPGYYEVWLGQPQIGVFLARNDFFFFEDTVFFRLSGKDGSVLSVETSDRPTGSSPTGSSSGVMSFESTTAAIVIGSILLLLWM